MNREKQAELDRLVQQYRVLQREHRAWQGLLDCPLMIDAATHAATSSAGVPVEAWLAFKSACIAHVEKAMAANRAAYDAL